MLTSYSEFLFESLTSVKLYYSKNFKDRLNSIYTSTQNAEIKNLTRTLMNAEDTSRYKSDVSFIDLTDKNDKIYFTPIARLKRLYDDFAKAEFKGGREYDFETWLHFQSGDKYDDSKSDSFVKYRQEVGVGRFVGKIFREVIKVPLSDQTIEKFVNEFKSMYDFEKDGTNRLELVSGEDIRKWYLNTNYSEVRGQLGNSCMRYDTCQPYLNIYVDNPEVCSLLVMWADPGKTKICGRALIWTLTTGEKVMDRIYTVADYQQELFIKWANDNQITWVQNLSGVNEIQLKKWEYTYYPYMDNFLCLNIETGILCDDSSLWPSPGWYKLQNTGGAPLTDNVVWSEYNGDYITQDEAVWCEPEGEWCHENDAIYLEYKDVYVSPNAEVVYSEFHSGNFYSDDCVYSDCLGDNLYVDEAIEIQTNYFGDEDWIPQTWEKSLVDVKIKDDFVQSLPVFTVYNPLTSNYHFIDDESDGDIFDLIEKGLKDVTVDENKIESEVIKNSMSDEKAVQRKIDKLTSIERKWLPVFTDVQKYIKYFIIKYPDKTQLRNGRLKSMTARGSKDNFKEAILVDAELMNKLGIDRVYFQRQSSDTIYLLCLLSYYFVTDFIKSPEILKMWYKSKLF